MSATGHVNPGLPIATRLVERGHQVCWYTGQRFRDRIEATGARYLPMKQAPDIDDRDINAAFPERTRYRGIAQLRWDLIHAFADPIPGQVRDYQEILREFPADVCLSDTAFVGPALLHEMGGPPWAVFGISVLPITSRDTAPFGMGLPPSRTPLGRLRNRALYYLMNRVVFRAVNARYQQIRGQLGLPRSATDFFDATLSPYLYLMSTVPAFEYPRTDLPPQVKFIGGFLPKGPENFRPPLWWDEMTTTRKPVVLVTQGTVATDQRELMIPTLHALEDEEIFVVATTGGKPAERLGLARTPGNARIVPFLPYDRLMPHVDAMVTNGGYGSVQIALAHGVPLVVSGWSEEKPEIGNRVAWSGVGIHLRAKRSPAPGRIRAAVRRVLDEPQFKARAARLQADLAGHDAPAEAAELLERLAATKRPV
jgi:MGT family glycosyltransferase